MSDEHSDPRQPVGFTPEVLDRSVLALPLLKRMDPDRPSTETDDDDAEMHQVVIDVNLTYHRGREAARERAAELVAQAVREAGTRSDQGLNEAKSRFSEQYLFARLETSALRRLVVLDSQGDPEITTEEAGRAGAHRSIHRIWPDFRIHPLVSTSVSTVKANAARASFGAVGEGMVWAVVDSGIDKDHPHFALHRNLDLPPAIEPLDLTGGGDPHTDEFGHGTHVAGILAGELRPASGNGEEEPSPDPPPEIRAFSRHRDENGQIAYDILSLDAISGIAPRCKLLSIKVLDRDGRGSASDLLAAIEHIQRINGNGRRLLVHGVNLSVGYDFEPEWFACGQSPLCVEVDRLVRSGVVVVVAAGNTGYGYHQVAGRATAFAAGLDLTINDPGNADLAITVGSTHREMPHVYGVSYFSSKGPTGDGRVKPDLVAPGEKILSCAAGRKHEEAQAKGADCNYLEDSGTSMAAPHVSGAVAALLSVRREFIGRPERVKEIFMESATDLRRDRHFQGQGLVDLMRAIQSV
ncbi:MAG: S8 family peptidase [Euzebyales bacterium]|nr:S8 family peptidase [Euzebyales bacterium]